MSKGILNRIIDGFFALLVDYLKIHKYGHTFSLEVLGKNNIYVVSVYLPFRKPILYHAGSNG